MSAPTTALPGVAWPDRGMRVAMKLLYLAWKHAGLSGEPLQDRRGRFGEIKWFAPHDDVLAQYDPTTDDIWLSTKLVHGENAADDTELARSIRHEVEHCKETREYRDSNEVACDAAAERFVDFLVEQQEREEINLKAAVRAALARLPLTRPPFPGDAPIETDRLSTGVPHVKRPPSPILYFGRLIWPQPQK